MHIAFDIVRQASVTLLFVLGVACVLVAAELAFPRGRIVSIRARSRALTFAAVYLLADAFVAVIFGAALVFRPLQPIIPATILGVFGAAILFAFAFDFFQYWLHRAQHSVPMLWRFHAVHHSIEEMGAPTGYQHPTEPILRTVFCAAPLSLIMPAATTILTATLLTLHGYYLHSATRLNLGRFAWVVCDNRVHRIHHSKEPKHFNKNFGVTTMLWDRLFGTAYFPNDEWPAIGIDGIAEPKTVTDYLLRPIQRSPLQTTKSLSPP